MDTEERLKALEEEFQITTEELKQILLDIRAFLMAAQTPLRADLNTNKLTDQSDLEEEEPHGDK